MKKEQAISILESAFGVKFGSKAAGRSYGNPGLALALYRSLEHEDPPSSLEIKSVESEGGYEGGGEHYQNVLEVTVKETKEVFFVQIVGSYNSYEGTEFDTDTTTIVEPYQRTATAYREVAE